MGDDPDAKPLFLDCRHRQADPIDGDGTFEDDVAHDLLWRGNVQNVVLPAPFPTGNLAEAVDVTGDKMATEITVRSQGAFQVDQRSRANKRKIRPLPGFVAQIESL